MQNSINNEIFEKANEWVVANQKVVIITVIQTWGSSPKPIGSKMIVNENGNFFGSVSAGCVESTVIKDSLEIRIFQLIYYAFVSTEYIYNY